MTLAVFDASLQLYVTHKYTHSGKQMTRTDSENINCCLENGEKFLGLNAWQPILVLIE